jgi:hypothetical protein
MFENDFSYKIFEKLSHLRLLFVIRYISHENCEHATRERLFCDITFKTFSLYQNSRFVIMKISKSSRFRSCLFR